MTKARPESTRIINLLRFADVESIDSIYVERLYYLAPDGKVAGELERVPEQVSEVEVALARQVISTFEGDLDLTDFTDEYQAELRKIIGAKVAGEEVVAPEADAPAKVVDLMEALRKSLDAVSASRKKPAKVKRVASRGTKKTKRA